MLTAKLSQSSAAVPGSPDSSSDSSTGGSPQHATNSFHGVNQLTAAAAENMLPGVLMSRDRKIHPFLCQLADLGSHLQYAPLRDAARNLLRLLPADPQAAERIFNACLAPNDQQTGNNPSNATALENVFVGASPSTILYYLEVGSFSTCFMSTVCKLKMFAGCIQSVDAGQFPNFG